MVESDVQLFALHILKGINYVHSKKIVHCDIKPANILLKPVKSSSILGCLMPNGFEPKLADFGLALRKTSDEYGDGCGFARGTLLYMAPELLCSGNLDYCADIWSYGCTILEMFTGKKPWSELGRDFLGKCLEKDPQKRYDSMYLLEHKFFASIVGHSY
ncbi:PREDICTED: mitogen-activated protein kinase kinase kinase NPK1-like [Brassica oleracea var. oleracea]|uniref:mitogen-activated protein kinase kinase kinase NPK1-like n=1 Tax=Brassica oleracea var. oleracea TaxID=109376 RepID=UPI0006A70FF8|nr:PREDICTED: mitogen-activated protein kinase kinase kinase NPK1-like [Brassica oleracea var. oleracea]